MLEDEMIYLRVIEKSDMELIKQWHNNYETTKYTSATSFIPRNLDEEISWYEGKIKDPFSRIFMIHYNGYDKPVGFVSFSNLDYRNQKAMISIVIGNNNFRGKGIARQSLRLIENLLSKEFHVRKVTVQVLEYNKISLSLFYKSGYNEEGILKKEIYRNGEFHDLYLLSKFL